MRWPVLYIVALAFPMAATALRVPADYPTIQEAIDAAAEDDRIEIATGTYFESLHIVAKELVLLAPLAGGVTISAPPGAPCALEVSAGADVSLLRIRLTAPGPVPVIDCHRAALFVRECSVEAQAGANSQPGGRGVQSRSSSLVRLASSYVAGGTGSQTQLGGVGLWCDGTASVILEECTVLGGNGGAGGGNAAELHATQANVLRCTVSGGSPNDGLSPGGVGVLVADGSDVNVAGGTVLGGGERPPIENLGGYVLEGESWTVPSDFPSVQSAIASAESGDDIKILPGTYVESLLIDGKRLTVRARLASGVRIQTGHLEQRPLTIDNGSQVTGIGLRISGSSINPTPTRLAALFARNSALHLIDCNVGGTDANLQSGATAISLLRCDPVHIHNALIEGGSHIVGGGHGILSEESNVTVERAWLLGGFGNIASGNGIRASESQVALRRTSVWGVGSGGFPSSGLILWNNSRAWGDAAEEHLNHVYYPFSGSSPSPLSSVDISSFYAFDPIHVATMLLGPFDPNSLEYKNRDANDDGRFDIADFVRMQAQWSTHPFIF